MGLGIKTEKDKFDLGDAMDFTLKLELPKVDEAATLSVLISGTDAHNTTSSVMFCSPSMKTKIVKMKKKSNTLYFINTNTKIFHISRKM